MRGNLAAKVYTSNATETETLLFVFFSDSSTKNGGQTNGYAYPYMETSTSERDVIEMPKESQEENMNTFAISK